MKLSESRQVIVWGSKPVNLMNALAVNKSTPEDYTAWFARKAMLDNYATLSSTRFFGERSREPRYQQPENRWAF